MTVAFTDPSRPHSLAGASALVTGAGSGIGRAVAIVLAARRMRVVLAGRRTEPLEDTARAVAAAGGISCVHPCDIDDDDACAGLADATLAFSSNALAVLVHSAARYSNTGLENTSVAELDAVMRTNVRAPFALTRMLLDALRTAQGNVVFINSSVIQHPATDVIAYAASKAALKAVADCMRQEVNRDGVRVLSVYPGRTATPMQARIHEREGREYLPEFLVQPEDVAEAIATAISLSRTSELTELYLRPARKAEARI